MGEDDDNPVRVLDEVDHSTEEKITDIIEHHRARVVGVETIDGREITIIEHRANI